MVQEEGAWERLGDGLGPPKHSIVSLGTIDFSQSERQLYLECRMREGAEITAEALAVNGFTEGHVKDLHKLSLDALIRIFFEWMKNADDRTLAGENPSFYRDFCRAAAAHYGIPLRQGHRTIDLHTLCYAHYLQHGLQPPSQGGRTDLNTDKILQRIGLPAESLPHHALTGAKMEAEAFSSLIYGRGLLPEFHSYAILDYLRE